MPPLPAELLAPMVAVLAALALFGTLLQVGLVIVRRLKLPQDLPEGPHFEPPPPPVSAVLEPTAARARAAVQARRRAIHARAHAAARAAAACAEAALIPLAATPGAPDPDAARAELTRHAAMAKAAAEAAERAMRGADLDAADAETQRHAAEAATAYAAAEAVLRPFPEPDNRRLRWLLILLGVMVVWVFLVFGILPRR